MGLLIQDIDFFICHRCGRPYEVKPCPHCHPRRTP